MPPRFQFRSVWLVWGSQRCCPSRHQVKTCEMRYPMLGSTRGKQNVDFATVQLAEASRGCVLNSVLLSLSGKAAITDVEVRSREPLSPFAARSTFCFPPVGGVDVAKNRNFDERAHRCPCHLSPGSLRWDHGILLWCASQVQRFDCWLHTGMGTLEGVNCQVSQ